MCFACESEGFNRRSFFRFAGLGVVAATAAATTALPAFAAESAISPDEALKRLQDGNAKFVADADACATNLAKRRQDLAKGQSPWAIVLTCSDSRVTPELIFGGVTLGELFVARNAGNVLDTDVLGTLEYGAEHLHAPLIVVMGHKRCGAVAAACEVVTKGTELEGSIAKMIQPILPIAIAAQHEGGDLVDVTVHENAIHGAKRVVEESPIIAKLVEEGKVKVVPAYYDLDSGAVQFLS
ncbi:carbonic anhydrase [Oryzibacter oryziterrae]|uniref:carbonic anhydrase n=1 Tax=Oryzibacter oryziterrae TaxID=2766474 RepID=UPI001F3BE1B9|nr:carbonic anhydrase [Oryzibacter oryziterrae]